MNEFVIVLLVISIGILISVTKYIISEKNAKETTYSDIFIHMIKNLFYRKSVLDNDYPDYPGDLERKDVSEYVIYLKTGVTTIINEDD